MATGMSDPVFSISVPVGAWAPGLAATLQSLSLQRADMQVALCDASGDERVAADADASGLGFAYRRHGPDQGQSDAIVEGWRETEGDVLAWLNADDALTPWALEEAAAAFRADPDLDVFYGQSVIVDQSGATTGVHAAVEPPSDRILRACTISQPSCFFRRRAVDAIGGLDVDRHYTMDWDLWIRLYRSGAKFAYSERHFSAVLFERGTKTSSLNTARLGEIFQLVRQHAGLYAAAKSALGFSLYHVGAYSLASGAVRRLRRAGWLPERRAGESRMTGSGRVAGQARLPVLNLTAAPQSVLHVAMSRKARVQVGDDAQTGQDMVFELAGAVGPGEAIDVDMKSDADDARFLKAAWL